MHPDLEKLVPLQALDVEWRRLHAEKDAVPKHLALTEAAAREASARQTAIAADLAKEETLRRQLQSDVADLRVKIARTQKKIDDATTTVQITALEHEAAFARAEIARMEDAELESMERSEALDTRSATAADQVSASQLALNTERDRARETLRHNRSALAEIDAGREQVRAGIVTSPTGEASLALYDRIAKSRGTAISEVSLGKCGACGMMVRPQLWQDLRDNSADSPSHDTLSTCENCGRLLFYNPARDAPQRKPVQGESIAASIVRSL